MADNDDLVLYVSADGVQFVYDDELAQVFAGEAAETHRASHVEPAPGGGWLADMSPVGGPVLTDDDACPFRTRAAALAAERKWLAARMCAGSL